MAANICLAIVHLVKDQFYRFSFACFSSKWSDNCPTLRLFFSLCSQIHTSLQHVIIWIGQPNALPKEDMTIADKLKQAGYATHGVGKWHIGFWKKEFIPINRGFDSFYGVFPETE